MYPMPDENEFDFNLDEVEQKINNKNKVEERFRELSSKVKLTSEERDTLRTSLDKELADKELITKERDFFSGFSDSVAKYPQAAEFKDSIKEKVLAGYTPEDATIAVLAKEGKLSMPTERPMVAGGSASNGINSSAEKGVGEMNRDELRAALVEAEQKGEFKL